MSGLIALELAGWGRRTGGEEKAGAEAIAPGKACDVAIPSLAEFDKNPGNTLLELRTTARATATRITRVATVNLVRPLMRGDSLSAFIVVPLAPPRPVAGFHKNTTLQIR